MRKRQRGMTTIGLIILIAFIGLACMGVIQLVPVYLENMKIRQVMNQTKTDLDGQGASIQDIRSGLGKRVNIESLGDVDYRKDFVIARTKEGFSVSMDYARERNFIYNVFLLAKFSHSVEIIR